MIYRDDILPVTVAKNVDSSFMKYGACVKPDIPIEETIALFYPERGGDFSIARQICAGCDVMEECLKYSIAEPFEKSGIWGGTSERQRRHIRNGRMSIGEAIRLARSLAEQGAA